MLGDPRTLSARESRERNWRLRQKRHVKASNARWCTRNLIPGHRHETFRRLIHFPRTLFHFSVRLLQMQPVFVLRLLRWSFELVKCFLPIFIREASWGWCIPCKEYFRSFRFKAARGFYVCEQATELDLDGGQETISDIEESLSLDLIGRRFECASRMLIRFT